jgi:hypothetical protein
VRVEQGFGPWKTFSRIIARHNGDAGTRTLSSAELFRILAFAQLTWRESLRDVEACLAANSPKLFHMGLRSAPARSTLADALNLRDWRIYQALALRLIARARALYADDRVLADLNAAVYALDSTTIDLCELFRLGAVPLHQGRHQAAHAARSARLDTFLHPYLQRQDARRARA